MAVWSWLNPFQYYRMLFQRNTNVAKIPFMVTKSMQCELTNLGFNERQIQRLTPTQAMDIIDKKCDSETWEKERQRLILQERIAKRQEKMSQEEENGNNNPIVMHAPEKKS